MSIGNVMKGAHILGFFRRICKLLFHGIKPVLVYDGTPPILKQATLVLSKYHIMFIYLERQREKLEKLKLKSH